jgi:hypothetical protein
MPSIYTLPPKWMAVRYQVNGGIVLDFPECTGPFNTYLEALNWIKAHIIDDVESFMIAELYSREWIEAETAENDALELEQFQEDNPDWTFKWPEPKQ